MAIFVFSNKRNTKKVVNHKISACPLDTFLLRLRLLWAHRNFLDFHQRYLNRSIRLIWRSNIRSIVVFFLFTVVLFVINPSVPTIFSLRSSLYLIFFPPFSMTPHVFLIPVANQGNMKFTDPFEISFDNLWDWTSLTLISNLSRWCIFKNFLICFV